MDRAKLIAYTESYLSFLFASINEQIIKRIILFGSVARGDFTNKSDIDIFIETTQLKPAREQAEKALTIFIGSEIYKQWTLRGIKNPIQLHTGEINRLSDLKQSLIADGIVLYDKFNIGKQGDHFLLIAFKPIKDKAKRYRIDRYLFGRNEKIRKAKGTVELCGGRRLASRSFVVPSLQSANILKQLKQEKVDFMLFDIWGDLAS